MRWPLGIRASCYVIAPARVTEASILATAPDLAKPIFRVSGPEGFVEAMGRMLAALGVPDAHVMRDYFPGYDGPEEPCDDSSAERRSSP